MPEVYRPGNRVRDPARPSQAAARWFRFTIACLVANPPAARALAFGM